MSVEQRPGMPGPAQGGVHEDRAARLQGRREQVEDLLDHDRQMAGRWLAHRTPSRPAAPAAGCGGRSCLPGCSRPGLHPRDARARPRAPGAGEVTSADVIAQPRVETSPSTRRRLTGAAHSTPGSTSSDAVGEGVLLVRQVGLPRRWSPRSPGACWRRSPRSRGSAPRSRAGLAGW